jgi:hypothetical protein
MLPVIPQRLKKKEPAPSSKAVCVRQEEVDVFDYIYERARASPEIVPFQTKELLKIVIEFRPVRSGRTDEFKYRDRNVEFWQSSKEPKLVPNA